MVLVLNLQDVQLEHANCFEHCGWQSKTKNAWFWWMFAFSVLSGLFVIGIWCAVAFCLFMTVLDLVSTSNSPQLFPLTICTIVDVVFFLLRWVG